MDPQEKERLAQEKYGKSYDQLSTNEQKSIGGEFRKEQMAEQKGGDVSQAYAEMGQKGGETRKEQMAGEHAGDVHQAYAEMGQKGGTTQREGQ